MSSNKMRLDRIKRRQDEIDTKRLDYRIRVLPDQLANARRKVAALEAEAARYGMTDLLGDAQDVRLS